MRICFLIPDGIGIRNYLYSDVIKELTSRGHEIILWHSLDGQMIQIAEDHLQVKFEQYEFVHEPDSFWIKLFRESARYSRLIQNVSKTDNPTILTNWTESSSSFSGKLLFKLAKMLGKSVRSDRGANRLEELGFSVIRRSKRFKKAIDFLKELNPDLLFCTHQRVYSVTPAIEAAKSLKIPTSTAIFSWDNLPKARLPFRTDQYLVWSPYMKNELEFYFPDISSSQIEITGTPQFDFYFQKDILLSREEFASKMGLDSAKNWVCFSGCDSLTSPNDPLYLEDVAREVSQLEDCELLFRPVPVESVDRFKQVLKEYSFIKLLNPKWKKGSHWGNYFPLYEDLVDLVNLTYHCKIVLNMGSTMALDFSVFGNLAFYLNYDHAPGLKNWSVKTIYNYQHFRSMGDLKAVEYIFSPTEIKEKVKKALEFPDQFAPDKGEWFNKIVAPNPQQPAFLRVADALESLVLASKNRIIA